MTSLIKRTATVTTLAAILVGTILSAQAQAARVVPAPQRGPGTVVHDRTCVTPNQAAARMASNVKDAGYLDTFRYTYFENNTKVQAFGVKAGDQWYAFVVELCRGTIIDEGKLKHGRPGFI